MKAARVEFTVELMWQRLTARGVMADTHSEVLPVFGQVISQARPPGTAGLAAHWGSACLMLDTTFAKAFGCLDELLGSRGS